MQGWNWRHTAGIMGALFCAVVVIYIANWQATYGFNDHIGDAFFRALSAFILFEWVRDYQTLLGGILAVVAASTIFINSAHERWSREQDRKREDSAAMRSDAAKLAALLRGVTLNTYAKADPQAVLTQLENISADLSRFARFAPNITTRVQYLLGHSQLRAQKWVQHRAQPDAATDDELRYLQHAITAYIEFSRLLLSDQNRVERDDVESPVHVTKWEAQRLNWDGLKDNDRARLLPQIVFLDI